MPKRKREHYGVQEGGTAQRLELKRREVEKKLVHGKKLLNRALKTAKNFERRKLARKLKLARDEKNEAEITKLQREYGILKDIELPNAVDSYLNKSLLKSKRVLESGLLPDYINGEGKKGNRSEEELLTINNVTARMFNTKPVKESMADIFSSLYGVLGILQPGGSLKARKNTVADSHSELNSRSKATSEEDSNVGESTEALPVDDKTRRESPAWEGFNSGSGPNSDSANVEDFSRYDGLVSGSSNGESSEAINSSDEINRSSTAQRLRGNSREATISSSDSEESQIHSVFPAERKKTNNIAKQEPQTSPKSTTTPTSTFLPTLMGGYWSGSEDISDNDDNGIAAAAPRKNRRGQQARRAIWEKKFGTKANHLKTQGPARKVGDRDWDPRRGARASAEMNAPKKGKGWGRGVGGGRGGARGRGGPKASRGQGTGENAIAVEPRAGRGRGGVKKDASDVKPLHPSWEAARKVKGAKATATFQGRKVVFE